MQIVIHGINHQEKTSKDGNTYTRCGIKYRGKWYSGFGDEVTQTWEIGNVVDVDIWEEEGKPDENGDVKVYGNFVRLKPSIAYQQKPSIKVEKKNVDDNGLEDIEQPLTPESDLPF